MSINRTELSREGKILLLKRIQAGIVSIADLKERNNSTVIIYSGDMDTESATNKFWCVGSNIIMNKGQVDQFIKNMETVLYLPDNGSGYVQPEQELLT